MRVSAPAVTRLAASLVLALATSLAKAGAVPAGFEDLVAGQTEQLEIRLFDRSAGVSAVRVTLDSVQLEAPGEVLRALGFSEEGQSTLLPALSRELPRNNQRACRHGDPGVGCGYVDPPGDPGEVRAIYDEGEGVLRLFVARKWIPVEQAAPRFNTLTPASENAFLHQQVLNISGSRTHHVASARGTGVLGLFEHGHLATEWSAARQQHSGGKTQTDARLDSAWYRHDLGQRHYLQVGRMDRRNLSSVQGGSFGFGMLPLERFQGVRFGSTQAYVNTDEAAQAAPITVLLSRDARVEAFDGDRLLQSYELPAGIHQLDTRSFPFGSYIVQLRIHEDGVLVRSEESPFDKGGSWAETDPQWVIQVGRRTSQRGDGFDGERMMMVGMRIPFGSDVLTTFGLTDVSGIRYGEARLELRHRDPQQDMRISVSRMGGTDGSRGQQHQFSYRRHMSWNLYQQRLRGTACRSRGDTRDHLACADSLSASLSAPVGDGMAYMGYTRRQTWRPGLVPYGLDEPFAVPSALLPPSSPVLNHASQRSVTWQGSYTRALRWNDINVNARIGAWTQQASDAPRGNGDRGVYLNLAFSRLQRAQPGSALFRHGLEMRAPAHEPSNVTYNTGASLYQERDGSIRELAADLRIGTQDRYSASASAMLQNRFGHTAVTVAAYQQPGHELQTYGASHASGFALGRHGIWWGGGAGADAALAVQMEDAGDHELHGTAAELLVSGSRRTPLGLGERRLFQLPAYEVHHADIMDNGAHSGAASLQVAGAGGTRRLFLSPGRVVHLTVPVEVAYTFIGQAHDDAGQSITGARALNAPAADTGPKGGFVLEVSRRDEHLYLLRDGHLLQCPLTVRERRSVLLMVGQVSCGEISVAGLPAWLRALPRVARLLTENAMTVDPHHMAGGAP